MAISICISPQGNDKNSGGSEDPFASLNRAQQEIRSLINAFEEGQEQDIDVHLSGGIHRISITGGFPIARDRVQTVAPGEDVHRKLGHRRGD